MRTLRRGLWVALLSLVLPSIAQAEEAIAWQTDVDAARRLAAESNRLVVLHFWATWCGPCLRLDDTVFNDPNVGKSLDKHFVMVKLDADKHEKLMRQYGAAKIPTDVVITPQGKMLSKSISPGSAQAYVSKLSSVALAFNDREPGMYTASAPTEPAAPRYPVEQQAQGQPPPRQVAQTPPAETDRYRDYYESRKAGLTGARADTPEARYGQQLGDPRGTAATDGPGGVTPPIAPAPNPYQHLVSQESNRDGGAPQSGETPDRAPAANQQISLNRPPQDPNANGGSLGPRYAGVDTQAARQNQTPPSPAPRTPMRTAPAPQVRQASVAARSAEMAQPGPPRLPPDVPPLGFEGQSVVQMVEQGKWAPGNRAWGVIHRGRTYLFASEDEKNRFYQNPDVYAPALNGADVVVYLTTGQLVPGHLKHGAFYISPKDNSKRIYLFNNEASLKEFERNPARYVAKLPQAQSAAPRRQ